MRPLALSALLIVMLASGCGYRTERPFDASVNSIHVEMFRTKSFRRDIEFRLTEALTKRIEMDTPYAIAQKDRADTVLSGEILEVRQNTLGNDFRTDLPRETGTTYVINFRWQDQRDGRILAQRQRYPFTTTYIRPLGESFFDGSVRGLDGLAEEIVEAMESAW